MTIVAIVQSPTARKTREPGALLDRAANLVGALALLPGLLLGAGMFMAQSF